MDSDESGRSRSDMEDLPGTKLTTKVAAKNVRGVGRGGGGLRRPKQETLDSIHGLRGKRSAADAKEAEPAAGVDGGGGDRNSLVGSGSSDENENEEKSLLVGGVDVIEDSTDGGEGGEVIPMDSTTTTANCFGFQVSLKDYLRPACPEKKLNLPHIETKLEMCLKGIQRPIGITLLVNGELVVGDRGKDVVIMYDKHGQKIKEIRPGRPFRRPSDMVTLPDGRFAVRDNGGLQLFDETGAFMRTIVPQGVLGMCFGLATDGKGHLMTINTNKLGKADCMTKKFETDVLVIALESGKIVEQIQLVDVIADQHKSSCRFLHCDGNKLYVSDLGLNTVYVMKLGTGVVKSFGKRGKNPGEFTDVAGIAADTDGSLLVVDACNNRIQVLNNRRQFIGMVRIPKEAPLKRPSGILLDAENKAIYVLNLWSNSLAKYSLVKP